MLYILEPYLSASHKHWLSLFNDLDEFEVHTFSLPGRHWKWRMHGAAVHFAHLIKDLEEPKHILISEMCDVAVFKSLLPKSWNSSITIYFHENQICYPWPEKDQDLAKNRNNHYGFINFTSALAADKVVFNSRFHKTQFINALPQFLEQFPDFRLSEHIKTISEKSSFIPINIQLPDAIEHKWEDTKPTILWNHRWEYDKNPETFFKILIQLKENSLDFNLTVLGDSGNRYPDIFDKAKTIFKKEIIHFGFAQDKSEYHKLMAASHILPVTSQQDFFGISSVEAVSYGVYPLFPNRLAFPEHFPDTQNHLYNTDKELREKLEHNVRNWNTEKHLLFLQTKKFRAVIAEKYNPKTILKQWETHFKTI